MRLQCTYIIRHEVPQNMSLIRDSQASLEISLTFYSRPVKCGTTHGDGGVAEPFTRSLCFAIRFGFMLCYHELLGRTKR